MTAIPEIDVLLAVYGMLSPFDSTDGVVNCNSLFSKFEDCKSLLPCWKVFL